MPDAPMSSAQGHVQNLTPDSAQAASVQTASPQADIDKILRIFPRVAADGNSRSFARQQLIFHDLLQALPAAIYTTDVDGRITFFNQACIGFAGRTPKIGEMWCVTWKLFQTDGTPLRHEDCPMAIALKENRPIRGVDAVAEKPDGSRVHFTPYPTPLRDDAGRLVGAVNMLVDITERKRAEERMILLTREVDHRSNNLLAVVQAMLRLTKADSVEDFRQAFEGRLGALSNVQKLFSDMRWAEADVSRLIAEELRPYAISDESRIRCEGPRLHISSSLAQTVAVAVHELATNAAKYGALSAASGKVEVRWQTDSQGRLMLWWTETGGPPVLAPSRRGFGIGAIDSMVRKLNGTVVRDWRAEGLACELVLPCEEAPAVPAPRH